MKDFLGKKYHVDPWLHIASDLYKSDLFYARSSSSALDSGGGRRSASFANYCNIRGSYSERKVATQSIMRIIIRKIYKDSDFVIDEHVLSLLSLSRGL